MRVQRTRNHIALTMALRITRACFCTKITNDTSLPPDIHVPCNVCLCNSVGIDPPPENVPYKYIEFNVLYVFDGVREASDMRMRSAVVNSLLLYL